MRRLLLIILILMLSSCASVISRDLLKEAEPTRDIPFEAVRADIEKYIGKTFVWGGFIVGSQITDSGTLIEVVQNPIDSYGYILDTDISGGRFLALYEKQLDPMIYKKRREITVAGTLVEARKKTLKDTEYIFPVLKVKELYLWKDEYFSPYAPYYAPYYSPYSPYEPYSPYDPLLQQYPQRPPYLR